MDSYDGIVILSLSKEEDCRGKMCVFYVVDCLMQLDTLRYELYFKDD